MQNIFFELQDKYLESNDIVSIIILRILAIHWLCSGNRDNEAYKIVTFENFKAYHLFKIKSVISDLGYSYKETSIKVYPNAPNSPYVTVQIYLENTLDIESIFLDVWNEYHEVNDFISMGIVKKLFIHWFYFNEIKDDIKYEYYKEVVFMSLNNQHLPKIENILSQLGYNKYKISIDPDAIRVLLESTL